MKLLGLIGGVSPESTEIYVRLFNKAARDRLGGEHSANFILWHMDYGRIIGLYHARDWAAFRAAFIEAADGLKRAGADALMIGSNTSHRIADAVAAATGLPLIHILDATAAAMSARGAQRPLLLGTLVTMSGDYYLPALAARYAGDPVVPTAEEQEAVERIVIDELCRGVVSQGSRRRLQDIIEAHDRADGVILGCTELSMILSDEDCRIPVFDATALHAAAGMAFALSGEP